MVDAIVTGSVSLSRTTVVLLAVAAIACLDLIGRVRHKQVHYLFGVVLGTILSIGLLKFLEVLFSVPTQGSGPLMALGVLLLILLWRLLFGPWDAHVKATVLGTFLFWTTFHILAGEEPDVLKAHLIAIGFAIIPAIIWCALFLPYHRERISIAVVMFFSGMASTVPVLFYDALVRQKVELQFFVFRIIPESFNGTLQTFVRQSTDLPDLHTRLITLFLSFLCVGIIEEGSKYWVLRRNGQRFFSSIDDALQFAILVAIGFAFAENVTNAGYFLGFVQEYLFAEGGPQWGSFLGNIAGRSILTSMVHIVSTGVIGYFLGLAIFADPCLQDAERQGRHFWFSETVHRVLGIRKVTVFRTQMVSLGFLIAISLHAFSNFLVTLPDVLPGNPHTLGELLGAPPTSFLHYIALLLFPALLYVVGGFWLLTSLFLRKQNMKERGRLISTDLFVLEE